MKRTDFPKLDERYYEGVTSGGLRVRVVPKPGFSKQYAFVAVDYGAIDTSFLRCGEKVVTPDGIAHYLEHKMFDMPYGDAMNRFAQFGGNPNAFTSYTMTAYYVECTDHFAENLQTLVQFVFTPYFTQKSVDKERGIIGQEIRMYEDSASSRVYENLFRAMYREHPIRVPIAGTVESIAQITPALLETCHRSFYSPKNAMLCVVGDVDPEKVLSLADSALPAWEAEAVTRLYGEKETPSVVQPQIEDALEIARPMFLAGFKGEALRGRDAMRQEFIGDLAADLMLGASSPLYTELYGKGLIDSGFSAGYEGMKGVSLFSAGGETPDPKAVTERILQEAQRVSRDGFDAELFECLKRSAIGKRVRELDSFETICMRSCECAFDGAEYFEFPELYGSVTQDDVLAFIKTYLQTDRMSLSVITPKPERKDPA